MNIVIDGNVMVKEALKKGDWVMRSGFVWFRMETRTGLFVRR
jgi:hypothetical protein